MATIKEVGLPYIIKRSPYVIADVLSNLTGYHPVMMKLSTYSGELAFMEADEKTTKDFVEGAVYRNEAPARTLLEILKYSPGKHFSKIKTSIYVAACTKDDLAPADKTITLAKNAVNSVCKTYNCGHFEIYCNDLFEEAVTDYIEFYSRIFS